MNHLHQYGSPWMSVNHSVYYAAILLRLTSIVCSNKYAHSVSNLHTSSVLSVFKVISHCLQISTIQQIKNGYLHLRHCNMSDHNNVKFLRQIRPQKHSLSKIAQNSATKQFNYVVRWKVILDMSVIDIHQIVSYRRLVILFNILLPNYTSTLENSIVWNI